MSIREEIQNDLANYCNELGLNEVYGVLTGKDQSSTGRTFRSVTFCKARVLDGVIEIYGPKFIMVSSNRTNREVCRSVDEVKAYIKDTFA